jgi:selenocysteine lyase/cysteine desulfurase
VLERLEPYRLRTAPDTIPGCFETGTQSHEGMAGTIAAVDYFASVGETMATAYYDRYPQLEGRRKYIHAAMDCLFDYETELAARLIDGLQDLPGVTVRGVTSPAAMQRRVPTVSFTADGIHPDTVAGELGKRNIFVWSGNNYALEVTRFLGIEDSGGTARIGPVHYNSVAEIDTVLEALAEILPRAAVA